MSRSIEDILREAKNRNLFLANLYERRTWPAHPNVPAKAIGEWRAEFSHQGGHRDADVGATAAEALEEALARAKGLKGPENRPNTVASSKAEVEPDDII